MAMRNGITNGHTVLASKRNGQKRHPNLMTRIISVHGKRKFWIIFLFTLAFITLLYANMKYQNSPSDYRLLYTALTQGDTVDTQCHLPHVDPFDPSISGFWRKADPLQCRKYQAELTYITENGHLAINTTAMDAEQFSTKLDCQYRCFDKTDQDDVNLAYGPWTSITANLTSEFSIDPCPFVDVTCARSFPMAIPVYTNTHARVINDRNRLLQLDALRNRSSDRPPYSSVLIFVLDSVSHSNFIRSLPKTLKILKNLYGSVVFDGHTKVGDNSLPNAVAFLTGKRVRTVGAKSDLDDDMRKKFYDSWPFVWKEYANSGYVTAYAEDFPKYALFKYMSNGFQKKPMDYYYMPFWVHIWNTFLHMRSTHLCYGNKPKHEIQMDYIKRILRMHSNRPLFAFNWFCELGHDWMNQISSGDDDLADFFTTVRPYLNNTMTIVMSDHGHRFDPIRQTVIGRIEERMPFLSVSLPRAWAEKRPRLYQDLNGVLIRNSKILTSPFDLHETLQHFLSYSTGKPYTANLNGTRGASLFTRLPSNRQCSHAHIPEDFCVCQKEIHVQNPSTDLKVKHAVTTVVDHLNTLLGQLSENCAILKLGQILHAQTFLPNLNTIEDDTVSILYNGRRPSGFYVNYRVTFVTDPGSAMFEAALRYSFNEDKFNVLGDVNRINKYGNQSDCITSFHLRKFCYCIA